MRKKEKAPFPVGRTICFVLVALLLFSGCQSSDTWFSASKQELPVHCFHPDWVEPGFEEAVKESHTIVYAQVQRIQPAFEIEENPELSKGVLVRTPIELRVIRMLKGDPNQKTVTDQWMGGDYEGISYRWEGYPDIPAPGQRLLVFLGDYDQDLGPGYLLLEEDGNFSVYEEEQQGQVTRPVEEYLDELQERIAAIAEG